MAARRMARGRSRARRGRRADAARVGVATSTARNPTIGVCRLPAPQAAGPATAPARLFVAAASGRSRRVQYPVCRHRRLFHGDKEQLAASSPTAAWDEKRWPLGRAVDPHHATPRCPKRCQWVTSARQQTIACLASVALVVIIGCGGTDLAGDMDATSTSADFADVRSAAGYRIVGTPIAAVTTTDNGITTAIVILRTNKALPLRERRVDANVRLDGASGASSAIRAGDGRHHCYIQPVDEFPRRAHTGDVSVLTVKVPGVRSHLRMRLTFVSSADSQRRYKRLCGPRQIFDDPDA